METLDSLVGIEAFQFIEPHLFFKHYSKKYEKIINVVNSKNFENYALSYHTFFSHT